ncbi:MAG TPA: hypothetical protein VNZ26_12615 [Vicinamibacterales bacterium]|jgi:hypothetical protein|nr:hypothetical protein [Vicinamibacterales bacterium]
MTVDLERPSDLIDAITLESGKVHDLTEMLSFVLTHMGECEMWENSDDVCSGLGIVAEVIQAKNALIKEQAEQLFETSKGLASDKFVLEEGRPPTRGELKSARVKAGAR